MPIGIPATVKVYKKSCIICGREFETERHNVRCCSEECRSKNLKDKQKAYKDTHRKLAVRSTLEQTVRELNEYNLVHGTHLTYGKYKAMKFMEARG